jgi:thioredoxin-related protein
MIRFGIVYTQHSRKIANKFHITHIPTFRIFHSRGDCLYNGGRNERDFVKEPASYLEDLSSPVKRSWRDSMLSNPSVMLFIDGSKAPVVWAGISSYFAGKPIRFGISKKDPEMRKYFNVTRVPTVLFMDGNRSKVYQGKIKFRRLKREIETYFEKQLKI